MDDIQREDFNQDVRERHLEAEDRKAEYDDGHEFDDVTKTFTKPEDEETHDPDSRKY